MGQPLPKFSREKSEYIRESCKQEAIDAPLLPKGGFIRLKRCEDKHAMMYDMMLKKYTVDPGNYGGGEVGNHGGGGAAESFNPQAKKDLGYTGNPGAAKEPAPKTDSAETAPKTDAPKQAKKDLGYTGNPGAAKEPAPKTDSAETAPKTDAPKQAKKDLGYTGNPGAAKEPAPKTDSAETAPKPDSTPQAETDPKPDVPPEPQDGGPF